MIHELLEMVKKFIQFEIFLKVNRLTLFVVSFFETFMK